MSDGSLHEQPQPMSEPGGQPMMQQPPMAEQWTQQSGLEPEPAPKRPARRGRVAAVAGFVVLLAAVIGGTGFTAVTVDQADRDAGAPVWRFPKAEGDDDKSADEKTKARAASGLSGMLVPYGTDGYTRGPDIDEFGSDAELSGRQATALRKQSISGLPRSQRRQLEKQIDKQRIKGMAMRSYLSTGNASNSTLYANKAFTIDIVLSQMEDKKAVRDISTFQNEFLDALKVFRKGPKIKGHENAQCFLPPKEGDDKIDMMVCSAYQGDVLVSATAYGVRPLNTAGVAMFLREQLDRIAEPGEAV
ncbi:hypothetical protein ACWD4J_21165 [Streptomyces sp. NPDC002577]